ncbi:LptF/LptG family permease [Hyalangium rubrum]|uniref:LptF/LptG family permease n=1 Tax=Hyalangium rubrum TaxID=3103134 RepID=A0ABU5GUK2_9BACT|nr:LptF/LptG family permease [Hyalangium sp. s54d21]MDY7224869.1 LptF/LptG family permease [Hyalangium sp. s54d21]
MRATLFFYVMRTYVRFAVGIFAAVLTVFLVVDFVDRARMYTGEGWVWDVMRLYANKALVASQQLGPAALLLAAGATVSTLRKRGEVTALRALTFGPASLYLPIGLCALLACAGLIAFDETVVVKASRRVDEISTQRFNRWGDWRLYYTPKQWFRRGEHVFFLRAGSAEQGFQDVAILTLTPDFKLSRRLDAEAMYPLDGTRWRLTGVVERSFSPEGRTSVKTLEEGEYDLGVPSRSFRIRPGRPEQLQVAELREQVAARTEVGLASRQYELALQNRFAYPMAGFPAALLAIGLALRQNRRGHLTAAIVEGLLIAVAMWGLMVVSRTLVMTERMAPALAAWLPSVVLIVAALALWLRREGFLHLPQRRAPPSGRSR